MCIWLQLQNLHIQYFWVVIPYLCVCALPAYHQTLIGLLQNGQLFVKRFHICLGNNDFLLENFHLFKRKHLKFSKKILTFLYIYIRIYRSHFEHFRNLTFDWNHFSTSSLFLLTTVSYCSLISSRTFVKSIECALSTSTFTEPLHWMLNWLISCNMQKNKQTKKVFKSPIHPEV